MTDWIEEARPLSLIQLLAGVAHAGLGNGNKFDVETDFTSRQGECACQTSYFLLHEMVTKVF